MQISHRIAENQLVLSEQASAVIKALAYYNIFNYPLTLPEIEKYAPCTFNQLSELEDVLNLLKEKFIVYQFGDFYTLQNEYWLITRRQAGNLAAFNIASKAKSRSNFIQKFPFVRSVNISGSLSKNYFDDTTDIDYFIITKPGRIWFCRLLLTAYKKIFLLNSRKYFCINYYIDTAHNEIPDKNLFSATEIVTLRNQTGAGYYQSFIAANSWVKNYYPNFNPVFSETKTEKPSRLKNIFEYLFAGKAGDIIDKFAFKLTRFFISKKYSNIEREHFEVNLRTSETSSKHHPQGFQFKVLNEFDKSCKTIEQKHSVILS